MDEVYSHWTKRLVYTAGVKFLADEAGAHWLIDAIASHQHDRLARAEEFQVWVLTVKPDKSAILAMCDGNSEIPLIAQQIEYTDYPQERAELYLVRTPGQVPVFMLPCEY